VQVEIGRFFTYLVLVVFRIVAAVECPEALAEHAVDVFGFADFLVFTHDDNVRFDEVGLEARSLSEKSFDNPGVILRQHGGDRIPLRRKLKQREVVVVLPQPPFGRVIVDVGKLVLVWIADECEISERQAMLVVELALGVRIGGVAVVHVLTNVDAIGCKRDVIAIMANMKPPPATNSLILRATASFN
jgi:hypothetical protein